MLKAALHDPRQQRYLELLLEKNQHLNLTAARTLAELQQRHLEDSLELLELPEVRAARTLLDLGTGGGLPGIPLAIALPDCRLTLLDATQKKIRAVAEFAEALELNNVRTVAGRAEVLAHEFAWRQRFDVVVSRAVAPLPILLEYMAGFCRPEGALVCFKGPEALAEVKDAHLAMERLGLRFVRDFSYMVGEQRFCLLIFAPTGRLPEEFPRPEALIRKRPLQASA